MSEVHGDYGHSKASGGYDYSMPKFKNNDKNIALFGDNSNSNHLRKVLELNGGNVPIGGATTIQ